VIAWHGRKVQPQGEPVGRAFWEAIESVDIDVLGALDPELRYLAAGPRVSDTARISLHTCRRFDAQVEMRGRWPSSNALGGPQFLAKVVGVTRWHEKQVSADFNPYRCLWVWLTTVDPECALAPCTFVMLPSDPGLEKATEAEARTYEQCVTDFLAAESTMAAQAAERRRKEAEKRAKVQREADEAARRFTARAASLRKQEAAEHSQILEQ